MAVLPLFHINAPAYSALGSLAARASLVLLPGFSARGFIDDARRFGGTEFNSSKKCITAPCASAALIRRTDDEFARSRRAVKL